MSYIFNDVAINWINANRPYNGEFKAWFTKDKINATINEKDGFGLRYHWNYVDGKKDGISNSWWPNGNRDQSITWINGKVHGDWIYYSPCGKKRSLMVYKDNQSYDGLTTKFIWGWESELNRGFKFNDIAHEYHYKDGEFVKHIKFEPTGNTSPLIKLIKTEKNSNIFVRFVD